MELHQANTVLLPKFMIYEAPEVALSWCAHLP
jgi:hypothetical protein